MQGLLCSQTLESTMMTIWNLKTKEKAFFFELKNLMFTQKAGFFSCSNRNGGQVPLNIQCCQLLAAKIVIFTLKNWGTKMSKILLKKYDILYMYGKDNTKTNSLTPVLEVCKLPR